jgi:hypothetical protein
VYRKDSRWQILIEARIGDLLAGGCSDYAGVTCLVTEAHGGLTVERDSTCIQIWCASLADLHGTDGVLT